jgi:hypothetical protein
MAPATRRLPPAGTLAADRAAAPAHDRRHGPHHDREAPTGAGTGGAAPAPRWRRIAVAALPLGALAYVAANDPSAAGRIYPPCPSQLVLGLDCPGCGGLRGTHALVHGDVLAALDHNVLLPFLLAACAYAAALVVAPLFGRRVRALRPPRWAAVAIAVALVAFTVLRNLPVAGLEWMASGAGVS